MWADCETRGLGRAVLGHNEENSSGAVDSNCRWNCPGCGYPEIEKRRLFDPTPAELRQEAKGGIYIFDGLSDADIARAMDEEFARVQSMMFIRVKKTNENGEVLKNPDTGTAVVQDDGC